MAKSIFISYCHKQGDWVWNDLKPVLAAGGAEVLLDHLRRESLLPGEWEYLAGFRRQETQPPPEDELIFQSLRRRLLVIEENGAWRLRVPLMARWLRVRG